MSARDASQDGVAALTHDAPPPRRRKWRRATVSLVLVALVAGVTLVAAADGERPTEVVQGSPTCPEAGAVPGLTPDSQQVVDDAERFGCVEVPTTTTVVLPPTTTTLPSTTVPSVVVPTTELVKEESGLRVVATLNPPELQTAEILTISVKATDADGGHLVSGISWGEPETSGGAPKAPILECEKDGQDEDSSERTWTLRHSYRQPGRYGIKITIASGYCTREGRTLTVSGVVAVGAGVLRSNGPLPPIVDAGPSEAGSADGFKLGIDAIDRDGFIQRMTVDWGDGSPPKVFDYPLSRCRDPLTSFPGPSRQVELEAHQYSNPGAYNAKVTVTSVGCSGGDPQTAETPVLVQVP